MLRIAAVIILIVLVIGGAYFLLPYQQPQQPTNLTFSIGLPKSIVAGQSSTGTVIVENKGADASGVTAVVVSDAISASSSPVDVRHGSSSSIPITITAKDVPDGAYAVVVYLQYSNGTSTSKTDSKGTSIYLLPKLTLTTPRFEADLFHPFGKNSIGTNDSTTVLFQVQSASSSVIYSGMYASATLDLNVPGLSIVPASSAIGPIGPNGRTGDHRFKIISNGAPPGTYNLRISLYSKDNQLVMQETLQVTVTG